MISQLNIHHIVEKSFVNGPGVRAVIWTQGCPLHCRGCFNPETHLMSKGSIISAKELATIINNINGIRGLTISGGEPLIQTVEIIDFLQYLNPKLDILLFSGFNLEEIKNDMIKRKILQYIDAGLFGRYDNKLPHPFMGKKLVIRGQRIQPRELTPYFSTEIIIKNNTITATGLFKKGA